MTDTTKLLKYLYEELKNGKKSHPRLKLENKFSREAINDLLCRELIVEDIENFIWFMEKSTEIEE